MFFYTQITDPLVLTADANGVYSFVNSDSSVISRGFETNARLTYGIAKLFIGYTFTDAKAGYLPGDRRLTLTPRSKVNSALVFEDHENFKAAWNFTTRVGKRLTTAQELAQQRKWGFSARRLSADSAYSSTPKT